MAVIAVAMSGGVDSSVAAALLKAKGNTVIGVMMRKWAGESLEAEQNHYACYGPHEEKNIEDAEKVARVLGIPFHVINLNKEFRSEVIDYFCSEYMAGRTPNPCVKCNRYIKFAALIDKVKQDGIHFDYFASGHYVRLEYDKTGQRYILKKAGDLSKDQSYFLYSLSQQQLSHLLFPLGDYSKDEVRKLALKYKLEVNEKPESQDFIGSDYSFLLEDKVEPGPVFDMQGNLVGQHKGIPYYTIGQRKGLGIATGEPLYVTAIDSENNSITVGAKDQIYKSELIASELNWVSVKALDRPVEAGVKIRYKHDDARATITPLNGRKCHVHFREPQMAITPGQAVVFYNGDILMGGGTINA